MKTSVENRLIWCQGDIVNVNDAKINILSPTAQFGLNVFEGIPVYYNDEEKQLYAFRLKEHYERLLRSARLLQIDCPYSADELEAALKSVIIANEYDENLSVRQTLFVDGFGSWGSSEPVGMFVAPIPRGNTSAEYNKKGLHCMVTSWRRISDTMLSPRIKCGANYMNSRVGQREAVRNGYDTCLFLNEHGKVSEGPGSCFFMVVDNTLVTPMLTDSVLESITRDTIIRIAADQGIKVVERSIDRTEIYTCDEAFLCGSAMAITPILSVDRYELSGGKTGPMTQMLYETYLDIVSGKNSVYREWLTPIYE